MPFQAGAEELVVLYMWVTINGDTVKTPTSFTFLPSTVLKLADGGCERVEWAEWGPQHCRADRIPPARSVWAHLQSVQGTKHVHVRDTSFDGQDGNRARMLVIRDYNQRMVRHAMNGSAGMLDIPKTGLCAGEATLFGPGEGWFVEPVVTSLPYLEVAVPCGRDLGPLADVQITEDSIVLQAKIEVRTT